MSYFYTVIARLFSMAESERPSYGIAFGRSPVCANDRAGGAALEKSSFLLGAASKADRAFRSRTAVGAINSNLKFWIQISVTRGM